jgi:putative exporter of polyketide antibiotics
LGRASRLLAGVGVALIGSFLAGLVSGLATVLCGGAWGPSLLLAATFTASGWMFAAVAAVAAGAARRVRGLRGVPSEGVASVIPTWWHQEVSDG